MKRKILISINPEHVENIINGSKKFEYRKIAAKQDISSIVIYETTPVKRIVAEAEIIDVLILSPDELWKQTKQASGISKEFFDEYFKGKKIAYAYKLGAK
ncbi:MAG: ASCH domain-containing protein [Staphylococcus sp.]|nr:ASCH domain-containing protein [Staphylococcus sp.]